MSSIASATRTYDSRPISRAASNKHADIDRAVAPATHSASSSAPSKNAARTPTALTWGGVAATGLGAVALLGSLPARALNSRAAHPLLFGGLAAAAIGVGTLTAVRIHHDASSAQHPPRDVPAASTAKIPATVTGASGAINGVATSNASPSFQLETIAQGLGQLTQVTHAPGDQDGLWLVEKTGKLVRRGSDGKTETRLDISPLVSSEGERGLLSVAFHPKFAENGRLFVNYTDRTGDTHVAEAHADSDGRIDADSLADLMVIEQPYANHNGGQLQFGSDDMLYIGMGDGGAGGDPQARAQNLSEHLGKLLRIDVDHPADGKRYGIPADNPFVDMRGAKPEIYATGVRNPWRFSFDRANGDLWMGDVGQSAWEEVNYVPRDQARGANFGWDVREGTNSFDETPQAPGQLIDPTLQYSHAEGASITGGYVYRGNELPALRGYYVYADIGRDTVRALKVSDGAVVDRIERPGGRSYTVSFGEGPDGELYAVTLNGELTKIARGNAAAPKDK